MPLMQGLNLVGIRHGDERRALVIEECLFVFSSARMLNVLFRAETPGTDRGAEEGHTLCLLSVLKLVCSGPGMDAVATLDIALHIVPECARE